MKFEDASFKAILSDAQGNAIHNKGKVRLTMMVYTHNSCIALKETFPLANVKQPLIVLGKWLKKGWDLQKTRRSHQVTFWMERTTRSLFIGSGTALAFDFVTKISTINYVVDLGTELADIVKERG